jgi:alpha-tubulin suppressor-like RCC1 family protein
LTEHVPVASDTGVAWSSPALPQVAAGMWHSGAVVDGQLYMWGKGKGGRLGLGDEELRTAPTLLEDVTRTPALLVPLAADLLSISAIAGL